MFSQTQNFSLDGDIPPSKTMRARRMSDKGQRESMHPKALRCQFFAGCRRDARRDLTGRARQFGVPQPLSAARSGKPGSR